jgi:hypothetical protein
MPRRWAAARRAVDRKSELNELRAELAQLRARIARKVSRRINGHAAKDAYPAVYPADKLAPNWMPINPLFAGDPERTRTSDLRFRKPLLYPTELRDHWFQSLSQVVPCLRALI